MSARASGDGDPGAAFDVVAPGDPAWAKHDFYMRLAGVVESGARCLGSRVGAVAVRDDRVLGMGYNGTPSGYPNCTEQERGCRRCALRHDAPALVPAGRPGAAIMTGPDQIASPNILRGLYAALG
jgi:deoxycytidylate deaminase